MKPLRFEVALLLAGGCISLSACILVPDQGTESGTVVDIVPVPSEVPDPSTYVCNPMDGEVGAQSREQGIRGMLYYLEPTQPRYTQVTDYLTHGTFAQAIHRQTGLLTEIALYFNQLYVPTRPFDRGFISQGGQTLQTSQGNTLYEYFAIRHEGRLQLGSKPPGLYQLAMLSDDGAVFNMNFGSGSQNVINNDGTHPTRMGCAVAAVEFQVDDKIPFVLDYYQGPRYHISLVLMWRPWPLNANGQPKTVAEANDAFCGRQGNSFYFDSTQNPPQPSANYNALLARGWEPLAPENYLLPEEAATNPCNEPAPMIENFRVVTIANTSVTVAWETDRPATSRVIYRKSTEVAEQTTVGDGLFYTTHVVTVTGLTSNTDYVMRALSASTSGLSTESAPRTIRTRR